MWLLGTLALISSNDSNPANSSSLEKYCQSAPHRIPDRKRHRDCSRWGWVNSWLPVRMSGNPPVLCVFFTRRYPSLARLAMQADCRLSGMDCAMVAGALSFRTGRDAGGRGCREAFSLA